MQAHGKLPLIWTPNKEYTGDTLRIAAETDDLHSLIAYVQKLGMNRGKWRDLFEPQEIEVTDVTVPRSAEWIAYGKEVYERRCIGCHGVKGDGNGPAATFMFNQRPRNFSVGVVQVPAEPEAGTDRRRPVADHHPRRARHGDAGLVRAAAE